MTPSRSSSASSTPTASTSPRPLQKKVERLFYREDFRRSLAGEIGDIRFPVRTAEFYTAVLMEHIDVDAVRGARFKLVLDYAYGAASFVMPNVLSKLGADVLSVNPYASTRQSLTFNRWEHAAQVSELVRASGAHLGAVIDTNGEYITFVDDNGHTLIDDEALMALLHLVLADADRRGSPPPTVALPVSVGRAVEAMCDEAGATLLWTKLSTPHLMEVASGPGVRFAASQEGGYIFPAFLPAYDAVATLVETLALLASSGTRMSQVVAQLPAVRVAHEAVVTPWEKKGLVMRMVMEWAKDRERAAGRRGEGAPRRRLGAGLPRPRGAPHPRLGRSRHRCRRPGPGSGVRSANPQRAALLIWLTTRGLAEGGSCRNASSTFPAMNVPEDLRYTPDHEWARLEGGQIRIGITDYAQDALGDVVFVQLPGPGTAVQAGESFAEIESTKSVSDVYAPVNGTVVGSQHRARRLAPTAQRGPLRRRLALPHRDPGRRCPIVAAGRGSGTGS